MQCSGVSVPNWKYVIDININMNVVNMSHVHEVWHEGLTETVHLWATVKVGTMPTHSMVVGINTQNEKTYMVTTCLCSTSYST